MWPACFRRERGCRCGGPVLGSRRETIPGRGPLASARTRSRFMVMLVGAIEGNPCPGLPRRMFATLASGDGFRRFFFIASTSSTVFVTCALGTPWDGWQPRCPQRAGASLCSHPRRAEDQCQLRQAPCKAPREAGRAAAWSDSSQPPPSVSPKGGGNDRPWAKTLWPASCPGTGGMARSTSSHSPS